jgi:hypothetical protein
MQCWWIFDFETDYMHRYQVAKYVIFDSKKIFVKKFPWMLKYYVFMRIEFDLNTALVFKLPSVFIAVLKSN